MSEFNWDDLRYFLTFVRRGNAYNAGRALAVDHTTVRRRIRALELSLSTKLFDTSGGSMALTSHGELLFKSLEGIETGIVDVGNKITGADSAVAGRVRVGAPDGIGSVFLAPHLAKLGVAYPELVVELLATSRQLNVASREAEIAIVLSYPPPSRHVIRKLGTVNLRLHASEDYLERHEPIHEIADLRGHSFISYLDDHPFIPSETLARPEFEHFTNVVFSSNSIISQVSAAAAGAGIGFMPTYMAKSRPNLRQVLGQDLVVPVDFFLLVHADLRDIARYRATADYIVEAVKRDADQFD